MSGSTVPLADVESIRTLIVRQAQLVDRFRHDEWINECLADDVTWIVRSKGDVIEHRGKDAVAELMKGAAGEGWHGTHIVQPLIEVHEDTATSDTDSFYIMVMDDGPDLVDIGGLQYEALNYRIVTVVRYSDTFVRDASRGWLFSSRVPQRLGATVTAENV